MKTPNQIADEQRPSFHIEDGDVQETSWQHIHSVIVDAIEADRAQRAAEPDASDYVVDLASRVAIKLESSRIVRNFSPELHAEDPEAIVFYAEAHGQEIR